MGKCPLNRKMHVGEIVRRIGSSARRTQERENMGLWEDFRSNYARSRQRRGPFGAAAFALDFTLYERAHTWAEMRSLYLLARLGERGRRHALLLVFKAYLEPARPDHLALARAAVDRRDWSTAAAELRLWEVWDCEDNAELQRRELREAAIALERRDIAAARDHCVQAMKLKGWGDGDLLIQLLTREIAASTKA
jgi:hypothetical protein